MEEKHYASGVIWRERPNMPSKYDLLVQDVVSTYEVGRPPVQKEGERQTKFVGGMQRLPEDKLAVTLTREIVEETNLRYSGKLDQIWSEPVFDRFNRSKVDHVKYAFLVPFSECMGELRTEALRDGNDLMFPPRWVPAEETGRVLYRTHQPILLAALSRLGLL